MVSALPLHLTIDASAWRCNSFFVIPTTISIDQTKEVLAETARCPASTWTAATSVTSAHSTRQDGLPIDPISLRPVDWGALLTKMRDPRRPVSVPDERKCWRCEGSNGQTHLRWILQNRDRRIPFVRKSGGWWDPTSIYFPSLGAWVLDPDVADRCIEHFRLVDLQPMEELQPQYAGWRIELVDWSSEHGALFEARLDLRAAIAATKRKAALALGLISWLRARRSGKCQWYEITAESGALKVGMLISEPLLETELSDALSLDVLPPSLVKRYEAPIVLRETWANIPVHGHLTFEGPVRTRLHSGCLGHRVGSLFVPFLEAEIAGREPLLLQSDWDSGVERARQFGAAAILSPLPPTDLVRGFDPAKVPGWKSPAKGGHQLFNFQREAVEFALGQDMRCLIGDEMGLGKTASAIAATHAALLDRVLVVCPVNAIGVWQREIAAWSAPDLPEPLVLTIRDTENLPLLTIARWVLIGYETLAGRDEGITVEGRECGNTLHAFFTLALGKISEGRWKRSKVNPPLIQMTSPNQASKERYRFVVRAALENAELIRRQLDQISGLELDATIRRKLGRMVSKLQQPVTTALRSWNPQLVIADEAHRLKAIEARRTKAVRAMCTDRRVLLMTGTPLRNHARDGKSLLEIIVSDEVWAAMERENLGLAETVRTLLRRRMIRRLKKDVLTQLPPKLRQRIPVPMETAYLEEYAGKMAAAEKTYEEVWQKTGSLGKAKKAASGYWFKAWHELSLAKMRTGIPVDFIREVIEAKERVIVFAYHLDVLSYLEQELQGHKLKVGRVDGRTKPAERTEIERRFQAGDIQVFLGGILAAGEAITLTRADTVIFAELAWVPGHLVQAEDRGHRAGQTAPKYHIIHLVADIIPSEPAKKPAGLEAPIPLPKLMPEDYAKFEETGVESPELAAAYEKLLDDDQSWQDYEWERQQAEFHAAVENIDEHMINALDSKLAHIDAVLDEQSESLVAGSLELGAAMNRLARATEERVHKRLKRSTVSPNARQ